MNSVCFSGNLVRDVELTYLQSGTPLAKFSVAVTRRTKKGEEWINKTAFVDCAVFGKQAEWLAEGTKGMPVNVQGELDMEQWEKEGKKFSKLSIAVTEARLMGARSGGDRQEVPRQRREEPRNAPPPGDDIPFLWLVGFVAAASQLPWC